MGEKAFVCLFGYCLLDLGGAVGVGQPGGESLLVGLSLPLGLAHRQSQLVLSRTYLTPK